MNQETQKTIFTIVFLIVIIVAAIQCQRDPARHKYRVMYKVTDWPSYDYTDSIVHKNNGCIEYDNEDYRHIERCGTVEITKQY